MHKNVCGSTQHNPFWPELKLLVSKQGATSLKEASLKLPSITGPGIISLPHLIKIVSSVKTSVPST